MQALRNIIEIDEELCDGCGQCIPGCQEGALVLVDGKARLIAEKLCDGLGACLGVCPTGALKVIEREADAFDQAEVERRMQEALQPTEQLVAPSPCAAQNAARSLDSTTSALGHWPVQLRLVPPTAPFLQGADILLVADCVPVSVPGFHEHYIKDKVVLLTCPKFDDAQMQVEKLQAILQAAKPRSITSMEMEVPCCGAIRGLTSRAMQLAGRTPRWQRIRVSRTGEELDEAQEDQPRQVLL